MCVSRQHCVATCSVSIPGCKEQDAAQECSKLPCVCGETATVPVGMQKHHRGTPCQNAVAEASGPRRLANDLSILADLKQQVAVHEVKRHAFQKDFYPPCRLDHVVARQRMLFQQLWQL